MNVLSKFAVITLSAAALTACFRHTSYKGDGQFTDNGWMNYSNRYVIDLGTIDLANSSSRSYTLSGLPRAEFCAGVAVAADKSVRLSGAEPNHQVIVRMVLKSSNGQVIVSEEGPLSSWVASTGFSDKHSFLYRRGEGRDVPLSSGGTRGERLKEKPSGGWGTYFNSEHGASYSLTFEVLNSDIPQGLPARLEVSGWDR